MLVWSLELSIVICCDVTRHVVRKTLNMSQAGHGCWRRNQCNANLVRLAGIEPTTLGFGVFKPSVFTRWFCLLLFDFKCRQSEFSLGTKLIQIRNRVTVALPTTTNVNV
jgi:hypothetical protein